MAVDERAFLLLGLHRSGSSATAGMIHFLGVDMGQNQGLFENLDFVLINDEILWSAGGSWDNPPTRESILQVEQIDGQPLGQRMASFLEHARGPAWGVKDPRLLLTFDLWRPYFEALPQTTYVFIHRPFAASVRSLAFRDGFTLEKSLTVLAPYLEHFYRLRYELAAAGADIVDVDYGRLLDDPLPYVAALNARLGQESNHNVELVMNWLIKSLKRF